MSKEFDPENTHKENVKVAIDKIIGEPTYIKKKKKSEADQKRLLFKKIMHNIVQAEEKSVILNEMFSINLDTHNSLFHDIVEDFIKYCFNKEQEKIIQFYLYDRYSADGSMLELIDENNNRIKLDTEDDLWSVITKINNDIREHK